MGELDGALVDPAGKGKALDRVAERQVVGGVAERERAAGAVVAEGAPAAPPPSGRAGHLEDHREPGLQRRCRARCPALGAGTSGRWCRRSGGARRRRRGAAAAYSRARPRALAIPQAAGAPPRRKRHLVDEAEQRRRSTRQGNAVVGIASTMSGSWSSATMAMKSSAGGSWKGTKRWSSVSGVSSHRSISRGPVTSSRSTCATERPSVRRTSSSASVPMVRPW